MSGDHRLTGTPGRRGGGLRHYQGCQKGAPPARISAAAGFNEAWVESKKSPAPSRSTKGIRVPQGAGAGMISGPQRLPPVAQSAGARGRQRNRSPQLT